jgi:hypothetical protein
MKLKLVLSVVVAIAAFRMLGHTSTPAANAGLALANLLVALLNVRAALVLRRERKAAAS